MNISYVEAKTKENYEAINMSVSVHEAPVLYDHEDKVRDAIIAAAKEFLRFFGKNSGVKNLKEFIDRNEYTIGVSTEIFQVLMVFDNNSVIKAIQEFLNRSMMNGTLVVKYDEETHSLIIETS